MMEKKTLFRTLFGISLSLVVVGSILKIQHWPFGLEISGAGFILLLITALIRFFVVKNHSLPFSLSSIFIVLFSIHGFARLIKYAHMKELTLILMAVGICWVIFQFLKWRKANTMPKLDAKNMLFIFGAVLIIAGVTFKIQHWPFSSIFLLY